MYKTISKLFLIFCFVMAGTTVLAYTNPIADAGPDQTITFQNSPNFTTTLHGKGYETNGGYLTYAWRCNGGYLSNPNIAEPIFTMPATTSKSTSYNCTLTVRSNFGLYDSDNVIINVYDNSASNFIVQTEPATNNFGGQATLHGRILSSNNNYNFGTTYVWFEWGTSTSYGKESNHKLMNSTGYFDQNIADLSTNTTYHFRAVSQLSNGQKYYGKDVTFYSNATNTNITLSATTNTPPTNPTNVSTGLTNNFLFDSFFLPLMIALFGIWLFQSKILSFAEWADSHKIKNKDYIASKKLKYKITKIKEKEKGVL